LNNPASHLCNAQALHASMLRLALSKPASASPWLQMIARLGQAINHPDSVYYWAWKNNIRVFCPAITDGSIGDMLFFHSYKNPGLVVDVVGDIRAINDSAMRASPRRTGMIILGGGERLAGGVFAGLLFGVRQGLR
jgi:deoxyhypusine synthase